MVKCKVCGEREVWASYQGKCRECGREYARVWRQRNPDKVREHRRRWYVNSKRGK